MALPVGTRFYVTFPLRLSSKVTHDVVIENLRAQGFLRVAIDGQVQHLDEVEALKRDITRAKELLVVVDRLSVSADGGGRLTDAVGTAFAEGEGDCVILLADPVAPDGDAATRLRFTERFECPNDGTLAPTPTPQLFSFNNPRGACSQCNGFGAILEYDESPVVPYPTRSLRDGAIDPWSHPRSARISRRSGTSSTSAFSCGSIRRRSSAPAVTGASSSPTRSTSALAV